MSDTNPGGKESSEAFECPTCGKDTFKTRSGMRTHHTRVHGEQLVSYIIKRCKICGGEFEARDDKNPERRTTCGDPECKSASLSHTGSDHPMYKGKVEIVCEICNDSRFVYPSQEHKNVTCGSDECKAEVRRQRNTGENHYRWQGGKSETIVCAICGDEYDVYPSKVDIRMLCDSKRCFAEYSRQLNSGSGNAMWKGGTDTYYGPNWPEQREKRIQIDGEQCIVCRMTREKHTQVYGRDLHVHHIQRKESFRRDDGTLDYERSNRIENLRTFCLSHHSIWEGIPVAPIAYSR